MRLSVRIEPGKPLRLRGPARLSVIDGECFIAGARLSKGSQTVIPVYKSQSVYALSDALVEIDLGEGSGLDVVRPEEDVLPEWVEKASAMAAKGSRVVVAGPVEAGKTSFATLLANIAVDKGLRPCIVDADIGQEDIGPPGFVALSCPSSQFVWLRDLEPDALRFVGTTSPSTWAPRLLAAVLDLSLRAASMGDLVVINTDGWVASPQAVEAKLDMARLSRATHLVLLASGSFAAPLPKSVPGLEIVVLRSPQGVRPRSREERRILRGQAYRKAFEGSRQRILRIGEIVPVGSCLLSHPPLSSGELEELSQISGARILYASRSDSAVYTYAEAEAQRDRDFEKPARLKDGRELVIIPRGSEKGLLCSLVDPRGEEHPCIVESLDPLKGLISVVTRYSGEVAAIVFGRIRVDESYEDSWRGSRCPI